MKKQLTLCIIYQHPNILLGMKKQGFGVGKWNGFGGKVEANESVEDTARREVLEEAGVKVNDINKVGILEFEYAGIEEILEVHIFRTETFEKTPSESNEMRPQWFHVDDIPYQEMWPDDELWIPLLLEGKKFKGKFSFDELNNITSQKLEEIETL